MLTQFSRNGSPLFAPKDESGGNNGGPNPGRKRRKGAPTKTPPEPAKATTQKAKTKS